MYHCVVIRSKRGDGKRSIMLLSFHWDEKNILHKIAAYPTPPSTSYPTLVIPPSTTGKNNIGALKRQNNYWCSQIVFVHCFFSWWSSRKAWLFIIIFAIHSPFLISSFRDQKACLSAQYFLIALSNVIALPANARAIYITLSCS